MNNVDKLQLVELMLNVHGSRLQAVLMFQHNIIKDKLRYF